MSFEPSVTANETLSLNDLPNEILLQILLHFRPEDLCFIITKVCERWKVLGNDVILWKKLSYNCDLSSDISLSKEVRCAILLGYSTKWILNFAPSSVLNVWNIKAL
jgi:hypothetical protein